MVYAVVRVRGTVNINPHIRKTLELLKLTRANHCVLVAETETFRGMLQKVKDYTTWGEIDQNVLTTLIASRGMLLGDKRITDDYVKSATSYENIEKLSQALIAKEIQYNEIPEVKPLFRLNPPHKGYKSIKRSYINKGALGYRGKDINQLLTRML